MSLGGTYGSMPQNLTLADVDRRVLELLRSQGTGASYAPKGTPWLAVDLPLVTTFPLNPQDRDEINLLDEDTVTVARYVYSKKYEMWLTVGGGQTGTLGITTLSSPPVGGLLADGSAVTTSNPRLRDRLIADSSPYGTSGGNPLLPNLIDKFIVGAGNTYALGGTGGAATVTLSTSQIPGHTHTGPSHTHSVPDHTHSLDFAMGAAVGVAQGNPVPAGTGTSYNTRSSGATTTGSSGTGATGSTGGGTSHENLPPYVALTPFIWT